MGLGINNASDAIVFIFCAFIFVLPFAPWKKIENKKNIKEER
jgi:hypothetical protein